MKIQAHPGFPPMPSIFSIAAANNPEKVPEIWGVNVKAPKTFESRFYKRTAVNEKTMAILNKSKVS